ncbi:MAG TPA: caspase family protein [Noviherbaspirillum sp.]|jgi:hypothetical protein|uniref:caspase family protein n=1 Tax=Noviherbaspirillum sp. TaxID=1926288 RepID=UPI002F92DBAE
MPFRTIIAVLLMAVSACAAGAQGGDIQGARSSRHALLIVIGNYGGGLPRLAGADRDAEHARTLARLLGIPPEQVRMLRDRDAGADAIRRAGTDLAMRIAPSDQVLVYFSGLGSSRADLDRPGGCEETFIAADGAPLGHGELAGYLLPVAERADKTMVFFDSCNTAPEGGRGMTARCLPSPDAACRPGKNRRWRGFVNELRKGAVPTANIIGLSAGRPEDPAWDDAASGGVFSSGVRACAAAPAEWDSDGSGALSFTELARCTQGQVERRLPAGPEAKPQLHGNRAFAPLMAAGPASSQAGAQALLEDLHAGRDGRRELLLTPVVAAGGELQALNVRASTVGYLYLLATEPQGGYRLLFPNADERDNRLRAGASFSWPNIGRRIAARGSAVLAIVADNQRDPGLLPDTGRAAFAADAAGRQALHQFVTTSMRSGDPACQEKGSTRNLSLARACSDAYAAALIVTDSR